VSSRAVTVRVPATSANLGPGYDTLGLALGLYDEVEVRCTDGGLDVQVEGESADEVARDDGHLVVRALHAGFDALGVRPPGLSLRCTNRIPHGRGLGSSAAAIVAGVVAARGLTDGGDARLPDDEALRVATALEGHPDNVAASLLGGLTIAWYDGEDAGPRPAVHGVRVATAPEVTAVAFVPAEAVSTKVARGLLPAAVPHGDAARNAGRAALLVEALTRRPDLLLAATEDRLHQSYRAPAMPASLALVERLREAGVAAVVSGAGPTVLALVTDRADEVAAVPAAGFTAHRLPVVAGAVVTPLLS
jgi:homoserine kinase